MSADIKPGSYIQITVTKRPSSAAATKTLSRVFAKDAANRKLRTRRKALRTDAMFPIRRGGRLWMVRPHAPRLVDPVKGATCTVHATVDVINDLGSVERFISVKPGQRPAKAKTSSKR